jgi:hypothetical protein
MPMRAPCQELMVIGASRQVGGRVDLKATSTTEQRDPRAIASAPVSSRQGTPSKAAMPH